MSDSTSYLNEDPDPGELPDPPVTTLAPDLPLERLSWPNFERLCVRIAERLGGVEHAQLYGTPGQAQKGIDIYARLGDGDYYVFQCRRTKRMGPADITAAVSDFLDSPWAENAGTFVLCAVQTFVSTDRADAVEQQAGRLKAQDKVFLPWGRDVLSDKLRPHRDLVRRFFGEAWEIAFCGHPPPSTTAQLQPRWSMREPVRTFAFREDDLEVVTGVVASLSGRPRVVVLHGLGGVGKTQLAAEWARRHRDAYMVGVWVSGPGRAAVISGLSRFARSTGIASSGDDERQAFEKLRSALGGAQVRWIMVLDDFDDIGNLPDIIPASGDGTVLVTSRRYGGWRGVGASPVAIGLWTLDDATRYLIEASADEDKDAAEAIARGLDRLPLAIAQAAAYVDESGTSLASYRQLLEERAPELLAANRAPQYDATVRTTWGVALERVEADSPLASTLLDALAYLAPSPVTRRLLEAAAGGSVQSVDIDRARRELLRFSLVQPDGEGITVHALVSLVVREGLAKRDDWKGAATAADAVLGAMPRHFDAPEQWAAGAELLAHALAVSRHIEGRRELALQAAELLHRSASYLRAMSDLRGAAELFRREEALLAQLPRLDPITRASFLNDYGIVVRDLGNLEEARRLLQLSLELKQQFGAPEEMIANSADNLGRVEQRLGNYPAAHRLLTQALDIYRQRYGAGDPRCALQLSNIGTLRLDERDPEGARRDFEDALGIIEQMPVNRDERRWYEAIVRGNLGDALLDLKDAKGALAEQERVLAVKQELFEPPHAELASTIGNLGNALRAVGDLDGAIARHEESLAMTQELYGPVSPDAVRALHNLANARELKGDTSSAGKIRQRAADMAAQLGLDWPPAQPDAARCE